MRILQVCNKPPYPPRDGGSLAMFNLASALIRTGHHVTVLTMITKKHRLTYEQHKYFSSIMNVYTVHVSATVRWKGLLFNLLFSRLPYTATRFISFTFEKRLSELLKEQNFDIIQLEGAYLTPYIGVIRKHTRNPIALRAHNIEHEIWERSATKENNFLRKHYFKTLSRRIRNFEQKSINQYDLLVPITSRDLDKFNNMGNRCPAHICPAGIDIPDETTDESIVVSKAFSLYFLGSLDWIPNQEGVLWFVEQVFPGIRKDFPDLRLHVAGRNAPDSFIRKLDFPGIVYHGEIKDSGAFSSEHTVMIAPTLSGSGMRLKILEAMANRKAVVTTAIGAEGLAVVHNENIMIADDVRQFQSCIELLIKYPDICAKISRQAFKLVKDHYNNNEIAASLADFYKQYLK